MLSFLHDRFLQPTALYSVRENYYVHSNYLAEFACTVSNVPILLVGIKHRCAATFIAGAASFVSHAYPSQLLHDIDWLGMGAVGLKVLWNYKLPLLRPKVAALGALAMGVQVADMMITRNYLPTVGPVIHVAWHFATAAALNELNNAQKEVTQQELDSVDVVKSLKQIPDFLNASFNKFKEKVFVHIDDDTTDYIYKPK